MSDISISSLLIFLGLIIVGWALSGIGDAIDRYREAQFPQEKDTRQIEDYQRPSGGKE